MIYLSLFFYISILNKNYKYLEELIKINYGSIYKFFLAYFNKFYEEVYKKRLI